MGVLLAEGGWMQAMEIECSPGIPEHPGDLGRKWHLEMEPLLLPCSNRLHLDHSCVWLSFEPSNYHLREFSCLPFAKESVQLGLLTVHIPSQRGREGRKTLTCVCPPDMQPLPPAFCMRCSLNCRWPQRVSSVSRLRRARGRRLPLYSYVAVIIPSG